ncbi:hypothetical protein T484DRAFT_3444967 [Baffinella frigidus]|nr:hypothetical protein T484DRAFT_3444967 [Cryptophyta sp. CCMP2293]
MPGVRSALLIASHIAFAAAFAPTCAPRLPGTFTGLAPNLRSLPALGDVTAPNRAGNARPALSGLTMEHNRVSRRQMGVWGAGIASVLVSAPGRATADVLAAPTSAADIVPASLTTDSWEAAAEKIRAGIGTRKPAVRVPGGGGKTQWTLMRESFRGKWTGPTTWFGKVDPASAVPIDWANPKIVLPKSVYDISFSDDLSGEWRGSGLRFTNKEVVFPLTGPGSAKTTCMFPGGLGMQSSLEYAVAGGKGHPANEVNFFDDRARSMIISLYKTPESTTPEGSRETDALSTPDLALLT